MFYWIYFLGKPWAAVSWLLWKDRQGGANQEQEDIILLLFEGELRRCLIGEVFYEGFVILKGWARGATLSRLYSLSVNQGTKEVNHFNKTSCGCGGQLWSVTDTNTYFSSGRLLIEDKLDTIQC